MPSLVPVEGACTRHEMSDVLAVATGLTHDVLVTVRSVLKPQLAVGVVRPETLVCSYNSQHRKLCNTGENNNDSISCIVMLWI